MSDRVRLARSLLAASGLAVLLPALACAQDLPFQRKAGLWEARMTVSGRSYTARGCTNDEIEQRHAAAFGKTPEMTPKPIPGGYRLVSDRRANGHAFHIVITVKGDWKTAYSMDTARDFDGKAQPPVHAEVKWAGACPAGMKPGETKSQLDAAQGTPHGGGP